MLRTASRTFCPSRRMPRTTSSEMLVALRSSRTRTTVPSRISRTMSSSREIAPRPGFPVGLHLAPDPADHVLADRALEQRPERPLHPPGVGAGEIGRRNQRLDLPGHPGVARQHGAPPFPARAIRGPTAGPGEPRSRPDRTSPAAAASACHSGSPPPRHAGSGRVPGQPSPPARPSPRESPGSAPAARPRSGRTKPPQKTAAPRLVVLFFSMA